jgi:putative DNA primase/helicase
MELRHDGKLDIATGRGRKSTVWKNKKITWGEMISKLSDVSRTSETYREYMVASKADQLHIKDTGGYVGGFLRNGTRKPQNVLHRQLLTLDIDFAPLGFWDDFSLLFANAAVIHATHKHSEETPRYRLVMPLDREVTPDEYVATARYIAGEMGIELFDKTTFQAERLMFWPSVSKDVDYYFEFQDGGWVDVDHILNNEYTDWTDSSSWPTADRDFQQVKSQVEKQDDPDNKKGVVGAFCRSYGILEGIKEFLPDVYVEAGEERYTYLKGTAAAGVITYEDKFAYSHHGTDPCSNILCNIFDLVRIHKFGHLDINSVLKGTRMKSYEAMQDFALDCKEVKKTIASERLQEANYDFAEDLTPEEIKLDDIDWMQELESDSKGKYLSTANNINLIFANDSRLKAAFKNNVFDNKRYVCRSVPWRKVTEPEPVKNVEYNGVRNYIETIYNITAPGKVDDSLALEFEKKSFHPVMDYLKSLEWDGVKRVDNLLIDYFGSDDNVYTKEAIRKTLAAAVARVFNPGVKYDMVLVLSGDQGTYKSTFVNKLGMSWYSDTFTTVHGKEAFEQIQGVWIMELAELAGLRKAEVEPVKHYVSKQQDSFRPAYGRAIETFKRQTVFIGTTNARGFLTDSSGNRRFNPVDVKKGEKSIVKDLTQVEVDQIWAEAVALYRKGEKLYLSDEANQIAKKEQRGHSIVDERLGIIQDFLDSKVSKDWDKIDLEDRLTFTKEEKTHDRNTICIAEIWCECLRKDRNEMDKYKTRDINEIMRGMEGWDQAKSAKNFSDYGKQRYFQRTDEN